MDFSHADDRSVGRTGGRFFEPKATKQRIALVPFMVTGATVNPTPEAIERAKAGDPAATKEIERAKFFRDAIQAGLGRDTPSVEKFSMGGDLGDVFLFPLFPRERVVFAKGVGKLQVPRKWEQHLGAQHKKFGVSSVYGICVYNYTLAEEGKPARIVTDPGSEIPAQGNFQFWSPNDPKVGAWKALTDSYPMVASDFSVWTVEKGKGETCQFATEPKCAWRMAGGADGKPNEAAMRAFLLKGKEIWDAILDESPDQKIFCTRAKSEDEFIRLAGGSTAATRGSTVEKADNFDQVFGGAAA